MSPDPRSFDHAEGAAPQAGARRPRTGSGPAARLLTVLYALVITPIATALIAYGGGGWMRIFQMRGYVADPLADLLTGRAGVQIVAGLGLGLLLLASVVATGIASSAGLLVVGVMGLFSLVVAAVPSLLFSIYRATPDGVPLEILDGFAYGLPLVLHTVMGGLGMALVIARRRPGPHLVASLAGLVVVPVMLLLGAGLVFGGLGHGALMAVRMFDTQTSPLVVALLALGALLLWLGAAASRWSPYALLLPVIVLLGASLAFAVPSLPLPPGIWSDPTSLAAASFLLTGGGVATAVILLVHTVVLAFVRHRSRRRLRGPGPTVPPAARPAGTAAATG
ncbi:hypothetical protein ACTXJ9_16910 [Brachybacterium tyrofermentans]|uniref:hypothetical protein n=1 Tax=Brachybacterium tyrofermentans TaxID=47848 RepID=UPI003FD6611E